MRSPAKQYPIPASKNTDLALISDDELAFLQTKVNYDASDPVARYLASLDKRSETQKSAVTMKNALNTLATNYLRLESIHAINWVRIDHDELERIVNILIHFGKLQGNTIALYLAAVRGVLTQLFLMEQISAVQFERIRRYRVPYIAPNKKREVLAPEIFNDKVKMLKADDSAVGCRDRAIIMLLVGCGLRSFECAKVQFEDINFGTGHINILGKGKKHRRVKLHEIVESAVLEWIEVHRGEHNGPLFSKIHHTGTIYKQAISESGIRHVLKERTFITDDVKFSPHDLRRAFATWLYFNGVPMKVIQELLGHASIKTTESYVLTNEKVLDDAISDNMHLLDAPQK